VADEFFWWLSFGYGASGVAFAVAIGIVLWRRTDHGSVTRHQREAKALLNERAELHLELIRNSQRLANLQTKAPEPMWNWVVDTVRDQNLLPKIALDLAYRFGFAVPRTEEVVIDHDAPISGVVATPDTLPPAMRLNAWGKPMSELI